MWRSFVHPQASLSFFCISSCRFKRILVLISHSQDFLNGVCTNIIHMHNRKLKYYTVSSLYLPPPPSWREGGSLLQDPAWGPPDACLQGMGLLQGGGVPFLGGPT